MEKRETLNCIEKKWLRNVLRVIQTVFWVGLTWLCILTSLHEKELVFRGVLPLDITLMAFPFILLGALYGYFAGYISFLIIFLVNFLTAMNTAYGMSTYLVALTCFAFFAQYFWFDTLKKTFGASFFTLLLSTLTKFVCLAVLKAESPELDILSDYFSYVVSDGPVIFTLGFLLCFFFKKVPDMVKMIFPMGVFYTKAYRENNEIQRSFRTTRVSARITAIIIGIELFLGISVAVFMIALFPDMKEFMIHNARTEADQYSSTDETKPPERYDSEDFIKGLNRMEFRFGIYAFVYDIKMILLMLCVGVPIGGIVNFYMKMRIGRPLGDLSDFMHEYANADDHEKIEFGHRIDDLHRHTKDEIGVVCESAKTMVHSIEDYLKRIEEEQKLKTDLEVAKASNEAKGIFLSNMSHEIRTPINAVLGMNEMILRESTEPQIEEYAQNVKSAGNSLLNIVNDILDFSKIEAGKLDILPVEYNLSSMINDLLNMISAKADEKGLRVDVHVDEDIPDCLIGDEVRIKQCVINILTNAVKYTEKGTVTMNLSYRKADNENIFLKFQVIDTGIGIKEEDLKKLFSPFERIEETRNRTIEGTGLGMSIVKSLLSLMHTGLEVKSVYGEGSDFSFEVRQQVADWEKIGDFRVKYKKYLDSVKNYHESFHAPDAKILVVDDTPVNLTVVKGLLKSTQIRVDTAESGKEAIDKVKGNRYDVLFIDHRMPEMDGLETLSVLKRMQDNLSIDAPCIALTANAGSGARDTYIAAGFDDYLAKPVDGETLERMLRHCLPKEKLIEPDRDETGSGGSSESDERSFLDDLKGIDLAEAVKNCGSKDILESVVKEFLISIDTNADRIEAAANKRDYRNYTVYVHALKSSARLIGAMELSKQAAYLEQCGNEENAREIEEKTPTLLALYRGYKEDLSAAVDPESEEGRSEISEDEMENAFSDMKELLEAYDFDTADGIMDMLKDYIIPDAYKGKYLRIKELMAQVDRDELLKIL